MVLIAGLISQECSCSSVNRDKFENNADKFNLLPDCMCHAFEIQVFYQAILSLLCHRRRVLSSLQANVHAMCSWSTGKKSLARELYFPVY